MTIQVTTSSSQSTQPLTTQSFSYDPTSDAPLLARLGPGRLEFRDVLADGTLGPVWRLEDITLVSSTEFGPRLRFPDGTEIVLDASPDQIAALLSEVTPAAGDSADGDPIDDGGSSQAVNEPSGDTGALGSAFDDDDDAAGVDALAGGTGDTGDGPPTEDPNLLLTVVEDAGPEIPDASPPPTPVAAPAAFALVPFGGPVAFVPDTPSDEGEEFSISVSDQDASNEVVDFDPETDSLEITDVLDEDDDGLDLGDLVAAGVTVRDSGAGGDVTVSVGDSSITLQGIGTGEITDLAALDDAIDLQIAA